MELETDAFESVLLLLELAFAQRHAIGFGSMAITNIVSALPASVQNATTAANTGVDHFDFQKLFRNLPKVYRKDAIFLMSSNTLADLTASLQANARDLVGDVNQFLGRPIAVCESLPDFGAGQAHIAILVNKNHLLNRQVIGGTYVKKYVQAGGAIEYGNLQPESFMRADFTPALFDSQFPPVAVLNAKA